jgi:large subunit ribosomal protein L15
MSAFELKAPKGANRSKKLLGRGRATGTGKTSGKGHKGQNSRSGGGTRLGFEGGQMPLFRRVAARGFSNHPFKVEYVGVNVSSLSERYVDGEKVNHETLVEKGLIKFGEKNIKILGDGELDKKLEVEIKKVTAGAREKIVNAGGTVVE